MLKLYFKLFLRRIRRKKTLFLLNFIGYILLLSVISLTTLFIYGELSYDNLKKKDRIYRLISSFTAGSKPAYTLNSSVSTLKVLSEKYPEIESHVNMFYVNGMSIQNGKKLLTRDVIFFEGDFINIFTPEFVAGNTNSFRDDRKLCFITKSFSEDIFKGGNCVGQSIILFNNQDTIQLSVAGVIEDFKNSTCVFGDVFVQGEADLNFYDDISSLSFLLLKEHCSIEKLNNIQAEEYVQDGVEYKEGFFFQSVKDIYLRSGFLDFNFYPSGNLKLLIILSLALLLMLSCVVFNYNFMFIVLLKARIKEFSLKRILGLERTKILYGVIIDSLIFVILAAGISFFLSKKSISSFDSLSIVLKSYSGWYTEVFALVFLIVLFITAVIPLFYYKHLIKFRRLDRLRNNNDIKNRKIFGNIFLAIQIIVAFVLLSFSFVIKSQIHYAVSKDFGIKNRDLVIIKNELSNQEYNVLSEELKKESAVSSVSRIGTMPPSEFPQGMIRVKCFGKEDKIVLAAILFVDRNTLETIGATYVLGEGFSKYSNIKSACVISESLANQIGAENIIGYEIKSGLRVIGVVNDISVVPVHKENYPLMIIYNPEMCKEIIINYSNKSKLNVGSLSQTYENTIKKYLDLTFYDDYIRSLYKEENFMLKYIALFSIIILCLVFFGFYFYSISIIDFKTKEIVIRKIHGASYQDIIRLLLKEYLLVYFISTIIGCILFFFISKIWISSFVFHIVVSIKYYIYPAILIISILLIAIINSVLKLARKSIVATIIN